MGETSLSQRRWHKSFWDAKRIEEEERRQFSQHKSLQLCFNPNWLLNKHWKERRKKISSICMYMTISRYVCMYLDRHSWRNSIKMFYFFIFFARLMLKEDRKEEMKKIIIYTYICKSLMLLILSIQKSSKKWNKWRSDGKGHDCCNYN